MLSWHVAVRLRKDQIQWDWCANTPPSPFLYQVHVEIGVQFIIHVMHTGVATFMIYSLILISKSIMSLDESMRPQLQPASRSSAEFSHNLVCPFGYCDSTLMAGWLGQTGWGFFRLLQFGWDWVDVSGVSFLQVLARSITCQAQYLNQWVVE